MPGIDETRDFIPLNIAVLTVSDTRSLEEETSRRSAGTRSPGPRATTSPGNGPSASGFHSLARPNGVFSRWNGQEMNAL